MFQIHIFNFADQALLLVIFQCSLLAILLPFSKSQFRLSNLLLSVFLLAIGITALDTLLYWNIALKTMLANRSIEFFLVLKFSVYITGPSLYFYTQSRLYSDFSFTRRDLIHAIPMILFPLLMTLTLASLSVQQKQDAVFDYQILFYNVFFQIHLTATFIIHTCYAIFSLRLIYQYKKTLVQNFSSLSDIDHSWLRMIIIGFIGIGFCKLSAHFFNWYANDIEIASVIGIVGNFFIFVFINTVVIFSLVHSNLFRGIKSKTSDKEATEPDIIPSDHVKLVKKLILRDKLYLHPSITLEQFAEQAGLSIRQLSAVINRHFGKNFFDFINYYRVENAKLLLVDNDYSGSMLDILAESGFNSKSAFNRFFKKYTSLTPSEFRRTCQPNSVKNTTMAYPPS
jgi:AraC-like DNA-binding protein